MTQQKTIPPISRTVPSRGLSRVLNRRRGVCRQACRPDHRKLAVAAGWNEPGEEPRQTALRSYPEEIGTSKVSSSRAPDWLPKIAPGSSASPGKPLPLLKQISMHLGNRADINLKTEHQEFTVWMWADIGALRRLFVLKCETYARSGRHLLDLPKPAGSTLRETRGAGLL
jgi:hypothetical protein